MGASASSRRAGGRTVVVVSGEVDLATGPAVDEVISAAIAEPGVQLVEVDLSGVEFLDSSGIALLLRGRRDADARGVGYRVIGARGMSRQVLELTGVWLHLTGDPHADQPTAP